MRARELAFLSVLPSESNFGKAKVARKTRAMRARELAFFERIAYKFHKAYKSYKS